ncbi:hypothetical protein CYY_005045 [Polysphondylium violaceum]|uniref:O-methyltransferase domain-containing protein n=1 Tax=Polysphondylium violaceum TaxID=133409 RepID=A0A8J4PU73_9MYCE|nr:hypothetical protein CYY_005045 [Polysphondylium violaceum]
MSTKESLPPIIGVYIMRCIYSITYYWEKIVPQIKFHRITHDFIVFQCLSVVFTLKVIDHLKESPKNVKELAVLTNSSEKNLFRVMRALSSEGFFSFDENSGKFSINSMSTLLTNNQITKENPTGINSDEESLSCLFSMIQYPAFIEAWNSLKDCVQTGVPGFHIKHGMSFFQYIDEKDTYLKKIFDSAMKQKNFMTKIHTQISQNYNFSDYSVICDIGGGVGYLGYEIISRHPKCQIHILEIEETVKNGLELCKGDSKKMLAIENEKMIFKVGDMFQPKTIPRANVYILMQVIHDWNNQDALRILSSITAVMRREKAITHQRPKLLIIDYIIEDNFNQDSYKKISISDIIMMAIVGGEERTRSQWNFLFKETGLSLLSVKKFNRPPFLSLMELTV